MRLRKIHLIVALVLGLVGLVLFFVLKPNSTFRTAAIAVPVYAEASIQRDVQVDIDTVGKVESFSTVEVKSQVEGQLTAISFEEGAYVNEGDPLFSIDSRPFQAKVNEAKANLQRDQATLTKAREDLRRYKALIDQDAISRQEYDQVIATAGALEATLRSNEAALANAKLELEYCNIKAPITGRTGRILVRPGNIVKANADTPLVTIEQMQPVRVFFAVPERYLNHIIERMKHTKLVVTAKTPQSDSVQETGVLSFIDNSVSAPTGTILLKALFENKDEKLWPGQFIDVKLHIDILENAIVIPSKAIQQSQKGPYVYVIKSETNKAGQQINVAELRQIKAGYVTDEETVVEEGLEANDVVITEGQIRLVPGAEVRQVK